MSENNVQRVQPSRQEVPTSAYEIYAQWGSLGAQTARCANLARELGTNRQRLTPILRVLEGVGAVTFPRPGYCSRIEGVDLVAHEPIRRPGQACRKFVSQWLKRAPRMATVDDLAQVTRHRRSYTQNLLTILVQAEAAVRKSKGVYVLTLDRPWRVNLLTLPNTKSTPKSVKELAFPSSHTRVKGGESEISPVGRERRLDDDSERGCRGELSSGSVRRARTIHSAAVSASRFARDMGWRGEKSPALTKPNAGTRIAGHNEVVLRALSCRFGRMALAKILTKLYANPLDAYRKHESEWKQNLEMVMAIPSVAKALKGSPSKATVEERERVMYLLSMGTPSQKAAIRQIIGSRFLEVVNEVRAKMTGLPPYDGSEAKTKKATWSVATYCWKHGLDFEKMVVGLVERLEWTGRVFPHPTTMDNVTWLDDVRDAMLAGKPRRKEKSAVGDKAETRASAENQRRHSKDVANLVKPGLRATLSKMGFGEKLDAIDDAALGYLVDSAKCRSKGKLTPFERALVEHG